MDSPGVDGRGLTFDYRLKPGLVHAGNALRLLAHLGYPAEIVDRALDQTSGA
jgi:DNA mismatch repair ATPase MutS